jgi:DNA-binding CsgD family transcriptional regulator
VAGRRTDDAALLDLVGDVMALLDVDEFRHGLIHALRRALASDWASLNEITRDGVVAVVIEPELSAELHALFGELVGENPLYRRYVETEDGRAYRFSDVATRQELHATRLYREFYAPLRVEHQIAFTLPSGAGDVVAVALSREKPDYSDDERDFLDRARPFLIQAYRNALAHSGRGEHALVAALTGAGLSPREAEVLRLVALGGSNRDVAARLGLSARTVQKHLENAFPKLGVRTRSEASARAWELARS